MAANRWKFGFVKPPRRPPRVVLPDPPPPPRRLTLRDVYEAGEHVFGPAGAAHGRGQVPDPGATAHPNRPYYLGDDSAWHKRTGEFIDGGFVSTIETTASTTAADLTTTTGQTFTFTLDETSDVVVIVGATVSNNTINTVQRLHVTVDGTATTVAQFNVPAANSNYNIGNQYLALSLASGSHAVKIQFSVNAGTGSFSNRSITLWRGKT